MHCQKTQPLWDDCCGLTEKLKLTPGSLNVGFLELVSNVELNVVAVSRLARKTPVFSDQQIRQIATGDSGTIAQWTLSTAQELGICVRHRPSDKFVKAVSRLSDGVVDLDPVEELLVALGRAGVLSSFQRGLLQVHYLR